MSRKKRAVVSTGLLRIEWLRPDEEHQGLGLLVTGQEYDVPAAVAGAWIRQGAAAPAMVKNVDAPMPGQEE